MLDTDIQRLADRSPDAELDGLEAHVWAGVEARERTARVSRRFLALLVLVLAAALGGSLLAGRSAVSASRSGLDVFSPRMALSASALLAGRSP